MSQPSIDKLRLIYEHWAHGRMSRIASQLGDRSELGGYAAKILVVSGAYFATAKLGLQLASAHPSITAVWPPTGISLAALLIWGYRLWPGVALGAALANSFTGDVPPVTVLGITIGNTLEALVGAYLLLRVARFRSSLDRVRDVLALVVLAAGLSTMVSATVGVTSLWIGNQITVGELPSAWRVWWLGDMGGDLLVAPFLLVLASGVRPIRRPARVAEACALLCTIVALSLLIFSRAAPLTYLIFPPLIWAALRFRQLGATLSSLIVAGIAVGFTEQDLGPFARGSPDDSFLLSQTFMGVGAVAALLLAAITSERGQAEDELQRAHDKLEGKVEERTAELDRSHKELELQGLIARNMAEGVCLVRASDSAIVYANPEFERMFGYDSGELNGKHVATLNYEDGAVAATDVARGIAQELERSGEATYEVLNRKRDGTPLWCRVHTSAFEHPEYGKVWVAVQEDITERKRADVLERSLIPERLPEIPGLKLAARFVPGGAGVEVGGDWYDVLEIDDGSIGLAIGDVAGRGVQAAAIMAQLRNALRAYAFESHPPATALERLNRLAWSLDRSVMATLIYLVFDPSSGLVRLANAGHLPPLQAKPDGSTRYLEKGRSLPLGVRPATAYSEAEYLLGPGSTLLLYTDGLVEKRRTPIDDGLARLARCSSLGHDDLEDLCDRLLDTLSPTGEDDVALLALAPIQLAPGRLKLTMPAEPLALGSLRRALRRWLRQCEASDEESYEIILACNEAFANAIEHAYGPGDGSVEMDAAFSEHEVSITVRDFGRWREPRGHNRGRGLTLIEAVMDSVNVVKSPQEGTEVRMVRKLERSRDGAA
jgi:PAS domain S-box-containing protein